MFLSLSLLLISLQRAPGNYADDPGSIVYDVLFRDDFSHLCNANCVSASDVLDELRRVSKLEQFHPMKRIIGINFMSVHDAFSYLLSDLNEQFPTAAGGETADDGKPPEKIVVELLLLLDTGLGNVKMLPGQDMSLIKGSISDRRDKILPMVQELFAKYFHEQHRMAVLEPLKHRHSSTGIVFLSWFWYLPEWPNAHEVEFGTVENNDSDTSANFCKLMDLLEDSPEPLDSRDLFFLADVVKETPSIVGECSPADKISTLLSHAVSGRQTNKRLLEFLVQMGGDKLISADGLGLLYRGVHLCAENGNIEAMKTLLCYSNFRDIDVLSPADETPLYIAVKHEQKDVFTYLIQKYARIDVGKPVMDIVDNSIKTSGERKRFKILVNEAKPYQNAATGVDFKINRSNPDARVAAERALRNDMLQNLAASTAPSAPRSSKKKPITAAAGPSSQEMAEAIRKADAAMAALLCEEEGSSAIIAKAGNKGVGAPTPSGGSKKKKKKK
jgi:hypothetical protein